MNNEPKNAHLIFRKINIVNKIEFKNICVLGSNNKDINMMIKNSIIITQETLTSFCF